MCPLSGSASGGVMSDGPCGGGGGASGWECGVNVSVTLSRSAFERENSERGRCGYHEDISSNPYFFIWGSLPH